MFDKQHEIEDVFYNVAGEYTGKTGVNEYFALDLKKIYPKSKYFICPEDVIGMPSANMVDGMALGSVYFGNENYGYLKDYGLKPWIHFIPHDGSVEGILKSYKKIEDDENLYQKIRYEGMNFIIQNVSLDKTLEKFIVGVSGIIK